MTYSKKIHFLLEEFQLSNGICTDSRKVEENTIYFALKGENFDGNKFAIQALDKGAKLAVVDDPNILEDSKIVKVDDSLKALQDLASLRRSSWKFPVLAIAGSNGKTTTKELIAAVLKTKYNVFSTPGNFNNHIGVPLSIMMAPEEIDFIVLELGANHLKENYFLCEIAKPNFGIVTNNGKDHLAGYGSLQNVIKSNKELYDFLREARGKAFVNSDDEVLMKTSDGLERITYGFNTKSDFNFEENQEGIFATIGIGKETIIKSNLAGNYNSVNMAAATAIGSYFGLSVDDIKASIENYKPNLNRSQLIGYNNFDIIMDAYNANPSSVSLAIDTLKAASYKRKMIILGGMLELGDFETQEHEAVFDKALKSGAEKIWLVGKEFRKFQNQKGVEWYESLDSCKQKFQNLDFDSGLVLIKGSRKYHLEKIID